MAVALVALPQLIVAFFLRLLEVIQDHSKSMKLGLFEVQFIFNPVASLLLEILLNFFAYSDKFVFVKANMLGLCIKGFFLLL